MYQSVSVGVAALMGILPIAAPGPEVATPVRVGVLQSAIQPTSVGGTTCKKAGVQRTVKGVSYLCTRSGRALRWSQISRAITTTTTTTTIVRPAMPTTWDNLEERASGVSFAAWKKASEAIASGAPKAPAPSFLDGANVVVTNQTPETAIRLVSRLFSSAKEPSRLTILRYGHGDVTSAQERWSSNFRGQGSSVDQEIRGACRTPSSCWGGVARRNGADHWIALATMEANKTSSRHTSGALEAHEYVHSVQSAQFENAGSRHHGLLPRWMVEGSATWVQAAVLGSTSYDAYVKERASEIGDLRYGSAWLSTFLAPIDSGWSPWNVYDGTSDAWRIYDVGLLVSEILVALGGPGVVMQLFSDVAGGQSFGEAFTTRFGSSWGDVYPIIARTIAKQIGT